LGEKSRCSIEERIGETSQAAAPSTDCSISRPKVRFVKTSPPLGRETPFWREQTRGKFEKVNNGHVARLYMKGTVCPLAGYAHAATERGKYKGPMTGEGKQRGYGVLHCIATEFDPIVAYLLPIPSSALLAIHLAHPYSLLSFHTCVFI
jgi:hypothetical protein